MNQRCQLRIAANEYNYLHKHLFPGDRDEHGAVLLAGVSRRRDLLTLHVREVHVAEEGRDYVKGKVGYRALHPTFIHVPCRSQS